jgi:acyl carrier protein
MSEQTIINSITPVFQRVFDEDTLVVCRSLDASQVEAWDSLNHITLVLELESLTGVTFTASELGEISCVGDFIDLLIEKGFKG